MSVSALFSIKEIWCCHIFPHLDDSEIARCQLVCTRWQAFIRDESLWKVLCEKKFHLNKKYAATWRKEFQLARISELFRNGVEDIMIYREHSHDIVKITKDGDFFVSLDQLNCSSSVHVWNLDSTEIYYPVLKNVFLKPNIWIKGELVICLDGSSTIFLKNWKTNKEIPFSEVTLKKDQRMEENVFFFKENKKKDHRIFNLDTRSTLLMSYNFSEKRLNFSSKESISDVRILCIRENYLIFENSSDFSITVMDITKETTLTTLMGHKNKVLSFSFYENYLASSSSESVKVWDWQSGNCLTTIDLQNSKSHKISVSLEGSLLALTDATSRIQIWDWVSKIVVRIMDVVSTSNIWLHKNHVIFASRNEIHVWKFVKKSSYAEIVKKSLSKSCKRTLLT